MDKFKPQHTHSLSYMAEVQNNDPSTPAYDWVGELTA